MDVSHWEKTRGPGGTQEGQWLIDPQSRRRALVKLPGKWHRPEGDFATGETWAEMLASAVGRRLALSVPTTEVATFQGREGVLIWDFTPRGGELREGTTLFNKSRRMRVHIDDVREKLSTIIGEEEALKAVTEMVLFDILIGNQDRHVGNWGYLEFPGSGEKPVMAPYSDNGAAFASSWLPETIEKQLSNGFERFDKGYSCLLK